MTDNDNSALLAMTTGIIANFVANNRVSPDELPSLVATVHGSLSRLGEVPKEEAEAKVSEPMTPLAIRKLITPEGITSLIDGRKFKSLKRHLSVAGYTPQAYREHFGLPRDFPMVHPDYAAMRSALARATGLGLGGGKPKGSAKPARKPRAQKA